MTPILAETGAMRGLGDRLKERARELGLSDSEVARRVGLSQARYSHYTNDLHEPDYATFVRIVRELGITADSALGMTPATVRDGDDLLRDRLAVAASGLSGPTLEGAVTMVEAMRRASKPPGR